MAIIDTSNSNNSQPLFWNTVLRFGSFGALALIVYSLLMYLLEFNMMSIWAGILQLVVSLGVMTVFAALAVKYQRQELDGGYIKFGRAFLIGWLTAVLCSFATSIWNYILVNFIDPEYINRLKEQFIATWSDNMNEETMEKALEGFDKARDLAQTLMSGSMWALILGAIAGLIAAAIMKRDRPLN